MNRPEIDIPAHSLRTLHSSWVDFIVRLPDVIQDAHLKRAGGLDFQHFALAVADGRYVVSMHGRDQHMRIGIAVPVSDGPDLIVCEVSGREAGVDFDWVVAGATLNLDADLAALLGER